MSNFNAYILMDRRLVLFRQEVFPERAVGTVLFSDISGFTPLTAVIPSLLTPFFLTVILPACWTVVEKVYNLVASGQKINFQQ